MQVFLSEYIFSKVLICLVFCITVCFNLGYSQSLSIEIKLPNYTKKMPFELGQEIKSFEYLVLETSPECLIGRVEKIVQNDSSVLILHSVANISHVYRFSMVTGRFLNSVARHGRGPGEYNNIRDFDIYDDIVYLLDGLSKKILTYSVSGEYISEMKIKYNAGSIGVLNPNSIFLSLPFSYGKKSSHSLALFTKTGKLRKLFLPIKDDYIEIFRPFAFSRCDEGLLYVNGLENRIYLLFQDDYHLKFSIDFGSNNSLDLDSKNYMVSKNGNIAQNWLIDGQKSNKPFYLLNYHLLGQHLYFQFFWHNFYMTCFSDISADCKYQKTGNYLIEDGYCGLRGANAVGNSSNKLILWQESYTFIDALEFHHRIEGNHFKGKPIHLRNIPLSEIVKSSNPLIFFVTFN